MLLIGDPSVTPPTCVSGDGNGRAWPVLGSLRSLERSCAFYVAIENHATGCLDCVLDDSRKCFLLAISQGLLKVSVSKSHIRRVVTVALLPALMLKMGSSPFSILSLSRAWIDLDFPTCGGCFILCSGVRVGGDGRLVHVSASSGILSIFRIHIAESRTVTSISS